jgi:hypothetical protein
MAELIDVIKARKDIDARLAAVKAEAEANDRELSESTVGGQPIPNGIYADDVTGEGGYFAKAGGQLVRVTPKPLSQVGQGK